MNKTGKILKFPSRPQKQSFITNGDDVQPGIKKKEAIKRVLIWLWRIARWPLFLVIYWLRMPILMICNLVSVPAMLAFLFGLYALPEYRAMVWGVGGISFFAFTLHFVYDYLLLWLSPDGVIFTS